MPFTSLSRGFGIASRWSVLQPTICRPVTAGKLSATTQFTPSRLTAVQVAAAKSHGIWQKTGARAEYHSGLGNGSDGDRPKGEGEASPADGIPKTTIILRECLIAGSKINIKWHPALQMSLFHAVVYGKEALPYDLKDENVLKHLCNEYIAFILRTHIGFEMTRKERKGLRRVSNGTRIELYNSLVWLIEFVEIVEYEKKYGNLPDLNDPYFESWMENQIWPTKLTPWRQALLGAWPEWPWNGPSQQSQQQRQPKRTNQQLDRKQRRRQLGSIRIFKIMQENPDVGSRWDSDFEKVREYVEYYDSLGETATS